MQETSAGQHKLLRCTSQPNSNHFGIDRPTHANCAALVVVDVPERYPCRAPPSVLRYFNRGYRRIAHRHSDISASLDDNLAARRACGEFHQFQGLCCCGCDSARCSSGASGTSPSAICAELRQADSQHCLGLEGALQFCRAHPKPRRLSRCGRTPGKGDRAKVLGRPRWSICSWTVCAIYLPGLKRTSPD